MAANPETSRDSPRAFLDYLAALPTIDKQPLAVIPAGIGGIGSADQQPEDVRFVKDGIARALQTLQADTSPEPDDQVVPLSPQMVGLRFTADHRARGCGAVPLRPRVAAEGLRKAIIHGPGCGGARSAPSAGPTLPRGREEGRPVREGRRWPPAPGTGRAGRARPASCG